MYNQEVKRAVSRKGMIISPVTPIVFNTRKGVLVANNTNRRTISIQKVFPMSTVFFSMMVSFLIIVLFSLRIA